MRHAPDWLAAVEAALRDAGDRFALAQLRSGDLLVVETLHTAYYFRIVEGYIADLHTDRTDRPSGRIQIQGCTFGDSSSITPEALFCGGSMEFTFEDGKMMHRTTAIRAIRHAAIRT